METEGQGDDGTSARAAGRSGSQEDKQGSSGDKGLERRAYGRDVASAELEALAKPLREELELESRVSAEHGERKSRKRRRM